MSVSVERSEFRSEVAEFFVLKAVVTAQSDSYQPQPRDHPNKMIPSHRRRPGRRTDGKALETLATTAILLTEVRHLGGQYVSIV
jgi:hypothetical protein